VVGLSRSVNSAERALRAVEAEAASRRIVSAQRDALVHQLDYLVSLQTAGAAGTEKEVLRTARAEVEAAFEKDAKLQQASIEGAIRALRDGSTTAADDLVAPLFSKTLEAAAKSAAAKPASKPFSSPQTVDIFRKRFGLSEWRATLRLRCVGAVCGVRAAAPCCVPKAGGCLVKARAKNVLVRGPDRSRPCSPPCSLRSRPRFSPPLPPRSRGRRDR